MVLGLLDGFDATVGTKSSGCIVAGSTAGLDLGTSGLRVALGRGRRPGRLVFGVAGLVCVTSGLKGILGFKEINGVLLGASVVHVGSEIIEILDVIVPGLVVPSGLVLGALGLRRRLGVEGIDVVFRRAGVVGCISRLAKVSSF